jgi:hypothetical protein
MTSAPSTADGRSVVTRSAAANPPLSPSTSTPPHARISESLESSMSWSRSLKPAMPNDRNGLSGALVRHGFLLPSNCKLPVPDRGDYPARATGSIRLVSLFFTLPTRVLIGQQVISPPSPPSGGARAKAFQTRISPDTGRDIATRVAVAAHATRDLPCPRPPVGAMMAHQPPGIREMSAKMIARWPRPAQRDRRIG